MRGLVFSLWFALPSLASGACSGAPPAAGSGPGAAAVASSPPVDDDGAFEAELLSLHAAALQHHRDGDWRSLSLAGADASVSASRGEVAWASRQDVARRFEGYLSRARFTRYEDLAPPIVEVSGDGTLGWVIARVRVEGRYRADDGSAPSLDATWAWAELYRRDEGAWSRVGTVSSYDEGTTATGLAGAIGEVEAPVREVLLAAEDAVGGRAILDGIEAIYAQARVATPRGPATTRVHAAADGRVVFDQTTAGGKRVVVRALRDGQWIESAGRIEPGEPPLRLVAEGHALHLALLSPTRLLRRGRREADTRFNGSLCRVLRFDDAAGNPVIVYYHAASGLPAGMDLVEHGSEPAETIRVTVDDWRWLGPLQVFHRARFEHRGQRFDYAYDEIRFHDIESEVFAPPTP